MYSPGEECMASTSIMERSESRRNSSHSVIIDLLVLPHSQNNLYCFIVTASNGTFIVKIKGTFNAGTIESTWYYVASMLVESFTYVYTGCDSQELSDGVLLPSNVSCGAPLHSLGIKNGIVCYSSIDVGATAIYSCSSCYFGTVLGPSVRICQPNGSWNGTIPQCDCGMFAQLQVYIS